MDITFGWQAIFLLSPMIALFIFSLVPLTAKVLNGNQEPNSFMTMSLGVFGVIAATALILLSSGVEAQLFGNALLFNGISTVGGLVVMFVTALALVYARENLATNGGHFSEYVFLFLNCAIGMLLVSWAGDLIFFFIGIELMSLCLYILIAISAEGRLSKESSFKYFVLGSFASAILLYGIAF